MMVEWAEPKANLDVLTWELIAYEDPREITRQSEINLVVAQGVR
jgi:hypothetical protein